MLLKRLWFAHLAMLPTVEFENSFAVGDFVCAKFGALYPGESKALLMRLFGDIDTMFAGRNPAYEGNNLGYHNLRHTLMATTCMAELLEGKQAAADGIRLQARDFELAIAAVLLHDAGYLKLRSDPGGTGAKYTYCHIPRSCAFAASYLPEVGVNQAEVEGVQMAINCTGPNSEIARLHFRNAVGHLVGCALATADYLGQLSDPNYPDKLGELFREFHESDEFSKVPPESRVFKSLDDLIRRTPAFWTHFVRPKLEIDFQRVYRFLARPYPAGSNPYLEAVEANLARVVRQVEGMGPARA